MYKFRDTTKQEHYRNLPFIPTSAMNYDGIWLEELIEGYQTLTVEGREMYSLSFESKEMQVGGVITNVKYPPRELTIKYKLEDNDPRVLQEKFDTLKAFLIRQEDVPIIFNDNLEYTFYGRFQTADNVAGDTNSIISSFTVLCSDPFKHGKIQIVKICICLWQLLIFFSIFLMHHILDLLSLLAMYSKLHQNNNLFVNVWAIF